MMASSQLADARVEAKVLQDMLGKANLATDKMNNEMQTLQRSLKREEAMRAEAQRVALAQEGRINELEIRLSHDRQIVQDTNNSRDSDRMKLMNQMEEERKVQEADLEALKEQVHTLRAQLRDSKGTPANAEVLMQDLRDECEKEAKAKLQKAVATEKRKADRAVAMLQEDYDDLARQNADLQKTMRDRIRHIEQNSAEAAVHGTKASESLKMRDAEVKRYEQEVTTLQVECSGLRAKLDSTITEARASKERNDGEREASSLALQTCQVDLAQMRVDLKSYKKKLRTSKDKRQTIEGELAKLKLETTSKIDEITVAHNVLESKCQKLTSRVDEADVKIVNLTNANTNLTTTLEATKKTLKKTTTELAAAGEGLRDAIDSNNKLSTTKALLETNLSTTKTTLETTQRALERAVSELRTVGFQTESFEHQLSAAVTALKKISNAKAKAKAAKSKPTNKDEIEAVVSTLAEKQPSTKVSPAKQIPTKPTTTPTPKKKKTKMKKKKVSDDVFGSSSGCSSSSASSDDDADNDDDDDDDDDNFKPADAKHVESSAAMKKAKDSDDSSSDSSSSDDDDDDNNDNNNDNNDNNDNNTKDTTKAGDVDDDEESDNKTTNEDDDDEDDGDDADDDESGMGFAPKKDVAADVGSDPVAIVQEAITTLRARLSETQRSVSQVTAETDSSSQRVREVEKVLASTTQSKVQLTQQKHSLEAELETEINELRSTQKTLKETSERETENKQNLVETTASLDETSAKLKIASAALEETNADLKTTKEKLSNLSKEFDENDMALKATNELLTKTTEELTEATTRAEEGEKALAELSDEFDKIKTAASSALDLLSSTRTDLQATQATLTETEQAKSYLTTQFDELTTAHEDTTKKVAVLETTQADLEESQDFVRSLTKKLDESVEQREALEEKVKAGFEGVSRAVAAADTKDKLFMANSERLYATNTELAEKMASLTTAQEKIVVLEGRVDKLERQEQLTSAECGALSTSLKEVRTELETTKTQLEGEEMKVKELEGKLNIENHCGMKLTTLLAKSENEINRLQAQLTNMEAETSISALETEALKIGVKDVETAKQSATEALGNAQRTQDELASVTTERDNIQKELATITNLKDEYQRKATAAERLVSSISVEKLKFATQAQKLQTKLDMVIQERSSIESGLSKATAKLGAIEHVPSDLSSAQDRIVELEVEVTETKQALQDLSRKHAAVEKLVSSVSVEKLKLQAKLDRLSNNAGNDFKESEAQRIIRSKERSELVEKVVTTFGCPVRLHEVTRESTSVSLGVEISGDREGRVQVTNVDEDSPTHGKLMRDDVIISVNGVFLLDSSYDDVVGALLQGGTCLYIAVATNEDVMKLIPDI